VASGTVAPLPEPIVEDKADENEITISPTN